MSDTDYFTPATSATENGHEPTRRRRKAAWIDLLENRHTRRQVSAQLAIRAEALRTPTDGLGHGAEQMAADDLAELLDELVTALRES